MHFEEALKHLREGKKIRRNFWGKDAFIYVEDNMCFDQDDIGSPFSYSEMIKDDWELYTDPQEEKQNQWRATHNSLLELHKRVKALEDSVQFIMGKLDL